MGSDTTRTIARLLWALPILLLFLAVDQALVAYDLRATYTRGMPATAEVVELEQSNRVDVTYDFVHLRIPLRDGRVLEKERLSLPHSLAPRLAGAATLDVHVRPGASQEVVIDRLMPAHTLIAVGQAGIAFLGALLLGWGVFAWNRYLRRQGDPAYRAIGSVGSRGSSG